MLRNLGSRGPFDQQTIKHYVYISFFLGGGGVVCFVTNLVDFFVSLTVHLSITLDNNQLDTQFFKYIYYNPLHVHVSSNILLILRRSNCVNTASGIVTLSEWPSGSQHRTVTY